VCYQERAKRRNEQGVLYSHGNWQVRRGMDHDSSVTAAQASRACTLISSVFCIIQPALSPAEPAAAADVAAAAAAAPARQHPLMALPLQR
jgi:hypothetical protein